MSSKKPYRPEVGTKVRAHSFVIGCMRWFEVEVFSYFERDGREMAFVMDRANRCAWEVPADTLRPVHQPGIGAVVAMVAVAKMVEGDWLTDACGPPPVHWDWLLPKLSRRRLPACGDSGWGPDLMVPVECIDEVTCEHCLRMYRRVYGEGAA